MISGLKWMTLVAWTGAQPGFEFKFGTDCTHISPPRPIQRPFYSQNTAIILSLYPKTILDVEIQVWRKLVFGYFGTPYADFLRGKQRSQQPLVRFTPFLLQYLIIIRTPYHKKSCDLVQWVVRY